jgi:hypothetical protein
LFIYAMKIGTPSDRALARASLRQGGHVTYGQLIALGLGRGAIDVRVRRGALIPVYRGIYAVGHLPTTPIDRAKGALLAAGPAAALSHYSAAALWQITHRWPDDIEVVVPTRHRPTGLKVHRSTKLLGIDVVRFQGVRATSRARTLLDLAPALTDQQLLRAVNGQRVNFRLRLESLHDVLERFPRHPGAARLLAIVESAPAQPYRSPWESEWPPYAERHGFPDYVMNEIVGGVRVDILFVAERVIVELDGWETHGTRPAFAADRDRRNALLAETGFPLYAMTYEQFHEEGDLQAERLHRILARRRDELGLTGE